MKRSSKAPIANSCLILQLVLSLKVLAQEENWPANVRGKTVVSVNGSPAIEAEMIIRYKDGTLDKRKDEILASLGATLIHRFTIIDADAVELSSGASVSSALPAAESIPDVRSTEANYVFKADGWKSDDDPLLPRQLWYHTIQGQLALQVAGKIKGVPIVVAVLDTGVNYNHPDLKDSMWINEAEINGVSDVDDDGNGWVDDIYGIDAVNSDGDPMDDNGHGTFIAGIISASVNNNEGVKGINPSANVMALKIGGKSGFASSATVLMCLEYAIANNAYVMNYSYEGRATQAEEELIVSYSGMFVQSAGNKGRDNEIFTHRIGNIDEPHIVAVASSDFKENLFLSSN